MFRVRGAAPRWFSLLALTALCFASGCAEDSSQGDGWKLGSDVGADTSADGVTPQDVGGDPVAELIAAEFSRRWSPRSVCGYLTLCSKYYDSAEEFFQLYCHPRALDVFESDEEAAALAGPRVELDVAAAERCLERLEQVESCGDLEAIFTDCANVLTGTQSEGEACLAGRECRSHLYCDKQGTCPGVCVARPVEGEPCEVDHACAEDLGCERGTCVSSNRQEGESCSYDWHCARGLTCCSSHEICGARTNVCVPKLGEGERCGADDGTGSHDFVGCQPELLCIGLSCKRGGSAGQACSREDPCALGLQCRDQVCRELSLPGGECEGDENCPVSYFCEAGICEPLPVAGESCESSGSCFEGVCSDGVCQLLPNGAACDRDILPRCESRFCASDDAGDTRVCAPSEQSEGVRCTYNSDCGHGQVCSEFECVRACTEI